MSPYLLHLKNETGIGSILDANPGNLRVGVCLVGSLLGAVKQLRPIAEVLIFKALLPPKFSIICLLANHRPAQEAGISKTELRGLPSFKWGSAR